MNILDFLKNPDVTIIQALLLRFRPVNMDVLPLYIVLMVFFPPVLWLLRKKADLALALSVGLYAITWEFELALPSYPSGSWFFNPYAWQLLFVFGAWCALGGAERMSRILNSWITIGLAAAYLLFAFAVTLTWHFPKIDFLMPDVLATLDVSDQQDRSRRIKICPLSCAGRPDPPFYPEGLAGA